MPNPLSRAARIPAAALLAVSLAFLALMALSPTALAQAPQAGAAQAAAGFYAVTTALKQGGIPDVQTRARLAPYVSAGLQALLTQADNAELAYAKATKHAVPPLLEGDIFTSLFEGASAYHVGECQVQADKAVCNVALSYANGDSAPEHWTDRAVLVRSSQGWRVDDIDYGGQWAFANKGTLRGNLGFAIQNANGP